jgi:hypothetical protein
MKFSSISNLLLTASLIFCSIVHAEEKTKELCFFQTANGKVSQVIGKDNVPEKYSDSAKCISSNNAKGPQLAKPEEIELSGNIRREDISSSLGDIKLRWPRKIEGLFGRTPLRALTDSANVVSKVIRQSSFPPHVQNINSTWNVVYMDENLPESQIPFQLISNCHPGWMTPPTNIYIVAQRIAAGCGGQKASSTSVADSELAKVLIHELGHAIEYQLLEGRQWNDRMRSEGFATWFTQYAANFSSLVSARDLRKEYFEWARQSLKQSPEHFNFQGSALDYARASLYFSAIENRLGIRGIIDVYKEMREKDIDFFAAADSKINWNRERLEQEVRKVANK